METVPNLLQSDEGKKRVIRNMQIFNKASKLRYKGMQEVLKENGGERPKNMASIVEERISPEMDALGREFAKNIDFGAKQAGKWTRRFAPVIAGSAMAGGAAIGLSGLGKILGRLVR